MELTDQEKTAIEIFTSEAGSFDVVHKIVQDFVEKKRDAYIKSTVIVREKSNEEIGAKFKAFLEAVDLVEGIFREIWQFKQGKVALEGKNPGR